MCDAQEINEEWIGDKARFSYDGLKRQRLSEPMIRRPDGQLQAASWKDALEAIAEAAYKVKPEEMVGVAGKLADAESMLALKDFLNRMGCERLWAEGDGESVDADLRSRFLLNTGIAGLEQADVCLLIGTQVKRVQFEGGPGIVFGAAIGFGCVGASGSLSGVALACASHSWMV